MHVRIFEKSRLMAGLFCCTQRPSNNGANGIMDTHRMIDFVFYPFFSLRLCVRYLTVEVKIKVSPNGGIFFWGFKQKRKVTMQKI